MWNNWKIASKIGLKVVVSNSVHFELQHTNKTLKFILRNKQYLHEGHEFIRLQIKIFYLYNKFTGKIGIFRIFYCFFFWKTSEETNRFYDIFPYLWTKNTTLTCHFIEQYTFFWNITAISYLKEFNWVIHEQWRWQTTGIRHMV